MLPSIEEGFGLVVVEAMASGCVPLISRACTEVVIDGRQGFVHEVADTDALTQQLDLLDRDRELLEQLRDESLRSAPEHTWNRAGERLASAYAEAIAAHSAQDNERCLP